MNRSIGRRPTSAARLRVPLLIGIVGASLGVASPAAAATITVNTTADELNTDSDCSLREALRAANTNAAVSGCVAGSDTGTDIIRVPAGTYPFSAALDGDDDTGLRGDLDIYSAVAIRGASATTTIVDAMDLDRVFDVTPTGVASLSRLTVRNGLLTNSDGGGILNHNRLSLTDAIVSGNEARGMQSYIGRGGGVSSNIGPTGSLFLLRVTITDNKASHGGGGLIAGGGGRIADSTISGNSLINGGPGGGILNLYSDAVLTLVGSTVTGNTAVNGDGLANIGALASLTNVTISGNGATAPFQGLGGGIFNDSDVLGSVTLQNVTLTGNGAGTSSATGGNLFNAAYPTIYARNTIAAHPVTGGNCGSIMPTSQGNNLEWVPSGTSTPCFNTAAAGNVAGDPLFPVDPATSLVLLPQDNGGRTRTHALAATSAALNKGAACAAADQRGVARPQGGGCDIGAYEHATCFGILVNRVGTAAGETLIGTSGADGIFGLGGNDRIEGRGGKDGLCGGVGNDTLLGQAGADRIDGGTGIDRASFAGSAARVIVNLSTSPGTATGEGSDTITGVENVDGSRFNDSIRGNGLANDLRGLGGPDALVGLGGNDRLEGGTGNDSLNGGSGTDTCIGGTGSDTTTGCER
ncbi:hypothetical protein BH20CHL6_BH20CHL6_14420 [soil metagenome]